MALTFLQSDMRFDLTASSDSSPTTPILHSPLWDFRPSFNPKLWSSGTTSDGSTRSKIHYPHNPSRELAVRLQAQFDEEDRLLLAERAELEAEAQRVFDCGVCMDTLPEGFIARIDPCGHSFCRDCVRGHITSQIESRRFPILCPTCTAEPEIDSKSVGTITRELVLDIGVTTEQYEIWIDMEMSEFLIRVECRRCNHTSFFDKEGFKEMKHLRCPQDGCIYVWCNECQQEIVPNGPEHSCDGSSELKNLVQHQGWKYCPTCGTPCEKISGCDHVSCITPGCNTHFCYGCGGLRARYSAPGAIAGITGGNTTRCRC